MNIRIFNLFVLFFFLVRIVKDERDGMIIFKKKPSAYDRKHSPNRYLSQHHHHSSNTSLVQSYQTDSCLMQKVSSPGNMIVEPLIVVDTPRSTSLTQLRSLSEPYLLDEYARLFHCSVPVYGMHRTIAGIRCPSNMLYYF